MKITTTKNREEGKEQIYAFPCLPRPGCPKFLRMLFFFVLGGLFVLLPSSLAQVPQVPSTMTYQGRILQNGTPFSGKGRFMFVIYAGDALTWNNLQGTTNPEPPTASSADWLELEVRNGVFSVVLGKGVNKNEALNLPVFFDSVRGPGVRENLRMEVWFSPGADTPPRKLSPDIEFASVPFAQVAQLAMTVKDASVGTAQIANGTVTTEKANPNLASALNPVGTVLAYAGNVSDNGQAVEPRSGYLLCNGATLDGNDAKFSALWEAIGTTYGGTGKSSFKVPDCRGIFIRGSGSQIIDSQNFSGGVLGSKQSDETAVNSLNVETNTSATNVLVPRIGIRAQDEDGPDNERVVQNDANRIDYNLRHSHALNGGLETRPANISMHFIIKY